MLKLEIVVYFCIFVGFLLAGFYEVHRISSLDQNSKEFVVSGWKWLNQNKNLDFGWERLAKSLDKSKWFLISHVIFSSIIRLFDFKGSIFSFYSWILGSIYLISQTTLIGLSLATIQMTIFYLLARKGSKLLLWTVSMVELFTLLSEAPTILLQDHLDVYLAQFLCITLAWNILRGISFGIDKVDTSSCQTSHYFIDLLGYFFYPPTLRLGPIVCFSKYHKMVQNHPNRPFLSRFKRLLLDLFKSGAIFLLMETLQHMFFISDEQNRSTVQEFRSPLSLFGFGYLMGLFFNLSYMVSYGTAIALGRFDGIDMPRSPCCIFGIGFYSDMWRHFDQGLYLFLFRYIYSCLCRKESALWKRFIASFVVFAFIFVWHGCNLAIFVWTLLNFVCIMAEIGLKTLMRSHIYVNFMRKFLAPSGIRRFNAFLGAQILIPATISNFFFFAGFDIGKCFLHTTYCDGFWQFALLSLISYSLFSVCEHFKRVKSS